MLSYIIYKRPTEGGKVILKKKERKNNFIIEEIKIDYKLNKLVIARKEGK